MLVHNQIDLLSAIMQKENKLLGQVSVLDQQRIQDINEYLISRGYTPNPHITVSDLIRVIFKSEEKRDLAEAQRGLMTILEELREINSLNQQLIQQSLLFIDYSLDLISGSSEDDVVYQHPKQTGYGMKPAGYFDTRA